MGVLDEFWRFALRRPTQSAVRESRPQRGREEIRRRLDLIILAHMWALAPLGLVWFLVPAWRDPAQPGSLALVILAASAVAYLLLRTWLNLTRRALGFNAFWPYVDVIIVTTALIDLRVTVVSNLVYAYCEFAPGDAVDGEAGAAADAIRAYVRKHCPVRPLAEAARVSPAPLPGGLLPTPTVQGRRVS